MLRAWRQHRHLSQLDLAHRADVSARHVSWLETGKARPSNAMILRLCEHLEVPLRTQNRVLLAGGFAPAHPEHTLDAPPMAHANRAIEQILSAHAPWPALVVDTGWDLVTANDAVYRLLEGVDPGLLEPPVNVIRLTLHPHGLAPRIANLTQWRAHLLDRIVREHDASADPRLAALLAEFGRPEPVEQPDLVVTLQIQVGDDVWSFITATTVFGTPHEVTLSELAIETFYPADDGTGATFTA